MPREFKLPELAESVVEGEIVQWLVAEGDEVAEDQPVVEVMTDKVTVELPSPFAGTLEKRLAAEGDVVPVHAPIALFSDEAGAAAAPPAEDAAAGTEVPGEEEASVQAAEERSIVEPGGAADEDDGDSLSLFKASGGDDAVTVKVSRAGAKPPAGAGGSAGAAARADRPTGPYGRVLAVPAARKLAREMGIDIEAVEGSGPNGRVRVDDVRAHGERAAAAPAAPAASGPSVGVTAYRTPEGLEGLETRIPVRGLRRAISRQMVASHLQTVRTLHVDEADMSALVELRARLKPRAAAKGVKLSYLPFIMKAVAAALREYPMLNASLDEEAGEIVRKAYYHLGMAVATDAGLVVPVVKDVDRRSILSIAGEVERLATAARDGKLASEDVQGGTFSITNIGSLGGLFSFPIINTPEAAILGVHSIKKRPVVLEDDTIVARSMLYLSCSFDHRLVDGAEAARFTGRVIELLEAPDELMLEL